MPRKWLVTYEELPEVLRNKMVDRELPKSGLSHYVVHLKCDCGREYSAELRNLIDRNGNLLIKNSEIICSHCSRSKYQKEYNLNNPEIVKKRIDSVRRYYNDNPDAKRVISDRVKLDHKKDPSRAKKLTEWIKNNGDTIKYNSTSSFEVDVTDFITSLGLHCIKDRSILNGKELDIYIPERKVAIECNGLYWHSSWKVNELYHYNKFLACKNAGIHLLQISDNSWYYNDKIKLYLKDLLTCKEKVYARLCTIRFIQPMIAKEFYNKYHIQGSNSYYSVNYGLYYNGELISCMSFGKSRVRNTVNKEGYYELHRYCVKSGYTILGGAEKLFKQFIKDYNPIEIKSFSDNDYFTGNIYKRLGFTETDYVRVYYWWNKNEVRSREECQLKYLKELFPESYNNSVTNMVSNKENYIMETEGYLKYYTSGRTKWVWKREY